MTKVKEKMTLHPVMTFLILTGVVMIISGVLNLLEFEQVTYSVNQTTLEYTTDIVSVENVFSLSGLKYIFSSTVSNFVNFAPLSSLIIILIGFGVMEKSGFLKTAKKYSNIHHCIFKRNRESNGRYFLYCNDSFKCCSI